MRTSICGADLGRILCVGTGTYEFAELSLRSKRKDGRGEVTVRAKAREGAREGGREGGRAGGREGGREGGSREREKEGEMNRARVCE